MTVEKPNLSLYKNGARKKKKKKDERVKHNKRKARS